MESSRKWRVRFKRNDGYFCFVTISKKGQPVFRNEVEEWASLQVERRSDYSSVAAIINEETEEA